MINNKINKINKNYKRNKRIENELKEIFKKPIKQIYISNIKNYKKQIWITILKGPMNTPYKGGIFFIKIEFPEEYPYKSPKVKFLTKIYHCNINNDGNICIDILKENWSPCYNIRIILKTIKKLLKYPNINDTLSIKKKDQYIKNKKKYIKIAKEWTQMYAK